MTYYEILNNVYECGSDNIGIFGGKFEGGYYLQQVPEEIAEFLYDIRDANIENYLEIGAAALGLTRIICDVIKVNHVNIIDLGEHPSRQFAYQANKANLKNSGQLREFTGDSHSIECKSWLLGLGVKFDLVIIDGDHSYEGTKQDFELIKDFFTEDAIIVFHDKWAVPEVSKFIDELVVSGNPRLIKDYAYGDKRKGLTVFQYE